MRADLLIVCTTLLASAGWIISKQTIQGLPPFAFIGLRFVLASLILLPFCYQSFKQIRLKDILLSIFVGSFLGAAILIWIYAISISDTLGEGAFIMSLSMLLVPLVAWPLFKQKPSRAFWISLPFAVIGLVLLSLSGDGWHQSVSQVWFLCAAALLALQFNLTSHYAQKIPTLFFTCVQLFAAGIMGIFASLTVEKWPQSVELNIWGWFLSSVLLATSLRYVLQTLGQKHTSVSNAAVIMVLEPVWTVILSIIYYGEKMPIEKTIGCVMILFSLVLYRSWYSITTKLCK